MQKDYNERIAELIPENIEQLKGYVSKYDNDSTPLGEKSQEKVRKFMHKLYSKYNSWTGGKIIHWEEEQTPLEEVEEELSTATKRYGPQTVEKIEEAVENIDFKFRDVGKYNKRPNIEKTFYVCADNVLTRSQESLMELADKVEKQEEKNDEIAVLK